MSRLIVKNLPSGMKEDRFRGLFAAFGTLTDCALKFTKDGKFRKFGFIGFKSEDDAKAALTHFNKSFIDTARVSVEFCKSFGDPQKPRAWSKHSQKPPATEKVPEKSAKSSGHAEFKQDEKKKKKNQPEDFKKLEGEEAFQDFLEAHKKRSQATTWSNDTKAEEAKKNRAKVTDDYLNFDSDESESLSEEDAEFGNEDGDAGITQEEAQSPQGKAAARPELSDMDYLRSKVVKNVESSPSSEEESEAEEVDEKEPSEGEEEEAKPSPGRQAGSGLIAESGAGEKMEGLKKVAGTKKEKATTKVKAQGGANEPTTSYTVKLRGAPFNVTEQNVREFLVPLRPVAIRIVRNAHGNKTGYVFVDFNNEEEVQKALKRNHEYMGGRYIELFYEEHSKKTKPSSKDPARTWQRTKKVDEEDEDLSDSGRLFVRNLPYTSTEEDLEKLFSKYGPLSEIHFPIDGLTKKPKGFAFVTYMFPEHAVKAFAEVDGQVFQGRMLHVLPSTIKKDEGESGDDPGASSYKKQKASKDKASSSSSHNWNTLFMGVNAVADAVAHKYNATKSQVFDHELKGSVAVRVALGETELVQKVRQFLLENGVSLDSFSQAASERSKTVILVKNLPAGTEATALEEVFGAYGSLGRVLLPEGGVTAIVEFLEPTEAKRAFTKLAYSKFRHIPLYLEWAPMGVFSGPGKRKPENPGVKKESEGPAETGGSKVDEVQMETEKGQIEEEDDEDDDDDEESLPGCTLFVKNLNFNTTEETLKEVFTKAGAVKSCTVSRKRDKAGTLLSMGFGFVEYRKPEHAQKALKQLQGCSVDGHQLEVKISERAIKSPVTSTRKTQRLKKQKSSKILVRNIPFQATVKEIRELFSTFGELKTVRLPKKMVGTGTHRGFGFVDFLTKQDAKQAFNTLCHSTHLYGRRLVLEWADTEETVEALRRKTAEHFHDSAPKKKKRSAVLEEILDKLEDDGDSEGES
uniref:Probable RNA-binding protein 19 n=1 Tax=Anolis carolinensis TaxID=28377 RepID=H9G9V1_ANOCA|nr:PREDICTED: probable RNA-binding protein 19 [Anolis carolinensis]XP_008116888.1 PREDICTED: probable RNA-binding protein 19 [Anolis carolinensis]XP_008116889.1 PREDICTED: probable RNA-binding protein 19 [Anolis carolinensis]|eukprot:XP_008116887.1 PREDICTED: probable RNA-binding protein 19 [Anolis carolinensis]